MRSITLATILVMLLTMTIPAHARKRNKLIVIGGVVAGAVIAGVLATRPQPNPANHQVAAHHGLRPR